MAQRTNNQKNDTRNHNKQSNEHSAVETWLKGNTMAQGTNDQKNDTRNRNKQNSEHSAILHIVGTLKEVYVGKKYAYAKIECYNNGDYYTLFRVAFPLDYDFPDDGEEIDVYAKITSYKNEYSFTACEDGDIEPF